jgi:ribonucleoside-diphosphate reductase subunit M2
MENIHSEVYSQLIDTYVKDNAKKAHLFQAISTIPSIRQKADWALKWTSRDFATFGERLVAFACVEGISFSSAFASIFYLKKRGLMMNGLGKSNELIARDEGMHRDFACLLFQYLNASERPSDEKVQAIVRECVEAECIFVSDSLPVNLIGMNANSMQE